MIGNRRNLVFMLIFAQLANLHLALAQNVTAVNQAEVSESTPQKIDVELLKTGAEAGDPELQLKLALYYLAGIETEPNIEVAKDWIVKAADEGFPPAQQALAAAFFRGTFGNRDYEQSGHWYLEAIRNQQRSKWTGYWSVETQQAFAADQTELGRMFQVGENVPVDYKRSRELLRETAYRNFLASALLGNIYLNGLGVERDLHEAFNWFDLAAKGGTREFVSQVKAIRDKIALEADIEIERKIVLMEGSNAYIELDGEYVEYDPVLSDIPPVKADLTRPVQVHDWWRGKELVRLKTPKRARPNDSSASSEHLDTNPAAHDEYYAGSDHERSVDGVLIDSSHRKVSPGVNGGVINSRTGEYYPDVGGGIINPRTGDYYPDVAGGVINPKTGEFYPVTGNTMH
jgi:hypothetical protein